MRYETLRDELRKIVTEHPSECRVYGARSEAVIARAEELLGVTLPDDYRSFVRDFGAGDFYGFEIYGVLRDQPEQESNIPSCLWATQSERRHGLPSEFIVIGTSGDGLTYALSTSSPFQVYVYGGYDFAEHPPKLALPGFCELLSEYIDQAKQMIDDDEQ